MQANFPTKLSRSNIFLCYLGYMDLYVQTNGDWGVRVERGCRQDGVSREKWQK